mmetsp:Transcript_15925/g.25828  ORF Transcript_15925/g.25828 Transcript_15925/m.25828 type:complete len:81 (-) Transcript_15925:759-1001(-)
MILHAVVVGCPNSQCMEYGDGIGCCDDECPNFGRGQDALQDLIFFGGTSFLSTLRTVKDTFLSVAIACHRGVTIVCLSSP